MFVRKVIPYLFAAIAVCVATAASVETVINDVVAPEDCVMFGPYSSDSLAVAFYINASEGANLDVGFSFDDNCSTHIADVSSMGITAFPAIFNSSAFFFDAEFVFFIHNAGESEVTVNGYFNLSTPELADAIASWVWYVVGAGGLAILTAAIAVWKACKNGATLKQVLSKRSSTTALRTF